MWVASQSSVMTRNTSLVSVVVDDAVAACPDRCGLNAFNN